MDDSDPPKIEHTAQGASVLSSGGSIELSWDDRDFVPNPRQGQYADVRYTRFTPDTGSDTRFDEYQLHYSRYHSLDDKNVLAWEMDGAFTQGDVPWSMMPLLGSNQRMRGYYEGRYRDKNAVSGQLEYRRKLDWRHGVVGWLGAGTMGRRFTRWITDAGYPRRASAIDLNSNRGLTYGWITASAKAAAGSIFRLERHFEGVYSHPFASGAVRRLTQLCDAAGTARFNDAGDHPGHSRVARDATAAVTERASPLLRLWL